jgi:hypothetical protein
MKLTIHDFTHSLQKSHAASDLALWLEVYKKAFVDFESMIDLRADGEHQRAGIDRMVVLSSGSYFYIDEKIRFKNYGDILLEYWSNQERKIPGWVCKPLRCHYIAYAIAPAGVCYLLPVIQLQAAWRKHGAEWIGTGYRIKAQNDGWTTISTAVAPDKLFAAIGSEHRIRFDPVV